MGQFNYREHEGTVTVICPVDLGQEAAKELFVPHASLDSVSAKSYIFDFAKTQALQPPVLKPFLLLSRAMRKMSCNFFSVNLGGHIIKHLTREGLLDSFGVRKNMAEALKFAGVVVQPPQVKVSFLTPFIDATLKTFRVQAELEIKTGKVRVKTKTEKTIVDLAGVMSISSETFRGAIAICFPGATYIKIYSKMMGEDKTTIGEEEFDAAAEILNIVFGQAKADLENNQGILLGQAIPTLVRGKQLELMQKSSTATMIIPFDTEFGPFHMEVTVEPNNPLAAGELKTVNLPVEPAAE